MAFIIQYMNIIKDNQTFIDSKLFWYLFFSQLKRSNITSSASSLIMISMVSLFKRITYSSSLSMEEVKLFAIVNWIYHASGFLRLTIMSFKYGLFLLGYSWPDSVLFLSLLLSNSI